MSPQHARSRSAVSCLTRSRPRLRSRASASSVGKPATLASNVVRAGRRLVRQGCQRAAHARGRDEPRHHAALKASGATRFLPRAAPAGFAGIPSIGAHRAAAPGRAYARSDTLRATFARSDSAGAVTRLGFLTTLGAADSGAPRRARSQNGGHRSAADRGGSHDRLRRRPRADVGHAGVPGRSCVSRLARCPRGGVRFTAEELAGVRRRRCASPARASSGSGVRDELGV